MMRSLSHNSGSVSSAACALVGLLCVIFVSACVGDGSTGRPGGGEPAEWFLLSDPALVLGGAEGTGPEMFGNVSGAAWMADGSILTADFLTGQIQRFRPDGSHHEVLGGKGEGPGEFRGLSGVFPGPGDTVWGYDNQAHHISGFFEGEHQRNLAIYRGDPVGWVSDRVVATGIPPLNRGPEPRTPGMHRDLWRVVAHAADGRAADTLVRGLSEQLFLTDDLIWSRPILALEPYVALGSTFVVFGDGALAELLVIAQPGDTIMTIPLGEIDGNALNELAEDAIAERLDRIGTYPPERRARSRAVVESIPLPEWIADISGLAVDSEDRIWVRRAFRPADSLARWDVFDHGGAAVAWINIPVSLTVHQIKEEVVLATDRDALDVSRVLVYRIRKGGKE